MAHTSIGGGLGPLQRAEVHGLGRSGSWLARVEQQPQPAAWLAGPAGTRVRIVPAGPTGFRFTFTATNPDLLAGRDAATHVNAFLGESGLSVKGTQYRHESDGPVLRVRDGNDVLVATVFLREALGAFGGSFDLTTVNGQWTGAALTLTGTLAGRATGPTATARAARTRRTPAAPSTTGPTITIQPGPTSPAPSPAPAVAASHRATALGQKVPKGYIALPDRTGRDLIIPARAAETFHTAVRVRFEAGRTEAVLAIGPTGTGKTESVIALCKSEGIEVLPLVQAGGILDASDVFKTTQPDETAPHGFRLFPSTLWANLEHAAAHADKRFAIVLDELNRCASTSAMNSLFGLLDNTAALTNPATGETVPLPSNVLVIATANVGSAYKGTVAWDAAMMSRFDRKVVFSYLPEPVEVALVESLGLDATASRILCRAVAELRKADGVEPFRSSLVPGTREVVAVAFAAIYDPQGALGAFHDGITVNFSAEGRDASKTEYARVRTIETLVFGQGSTPPQP